MTEKNTPIDAGHDDEWLRLWQADAGRAMDHERLARTLMARTWRFDATVFWRNTREYLAGAILLAVFVRQLVFGADRVGALIGIGSVGFVMAYLWWKHRGLRPLDPAADLSTYASALLARYDDQIRLLRSVTYWYLLPLSLPTLWTAVHVWDKSPWAAVTAGVVVLALYAGLRWLNGVAAVGILRAARANVEAMFPQE